MSNSSLFWQLFMATGQIGNYLLYKNCESELQYSGKENDNTNDLFDVASERG